MPDDLNGFTVKDILIEVRQDVKDLAARIDEIDRKGSIGTREELTDHENRLRKVEAQSSRAWGAFLFVTALLIPLAGLTITIVVNTS